MHARSAWNALAAAFLSGLVGCVHVPRPVAVAPRPVGETRSAVTPHEPLALPSLAGPNVAALLRGGVASDDWRGVGRISARVPGTSDETFGVRVARHRVRVTIEDGFAHTEVEEELQNDRAAVLEGRLEFAVPADATVSRLALLVGTRWMTAAMVERRRADAVFTSIVDASARPRDPALLERSTPSTLSLRVYPIPARGSRRVIIAYDQALTRTEHGLRYVYPLSAGADRSLVLDRFSIDVRVKHAPAGVTASWDDATIAKLRGDVAVRAARARLLPLRDFTLEYPTEAGDTIPVAAARSAEFALRIPVEIPTRPARSALDVRVIVIDKSASQTDRALSAARRLALSLLESTPRKRYALLACDTVCTSFPKSGFADTTDGVGPWLDAIEPSGASDIAGALVGALERLRNAGSSQLVYIGDGRASAGELDVEAIAGLVARSLSSRNVDLRLVASGPDADVATLDAIAASAHASVVTGPLDAHTLAELGAPTLRSPRLEIDGDTTELYPQSIPNQRIGGELLVMGRAGKRRPSRVALVGDVDGKVVRIERELSWPEQPRVDDSVLSHLHAALEIAELERSSDGADLDAAERLSVERHVMARRTSLIALENEAMYRDYGIGGSAGPPAPARRAPAHRVPAPKVRMAATMVSGRTPPESIRRILRQNAGRFRACYHHGLLRNPSLSGRVLLRFVIGRDGAVSASGDGGSDLSDRRVVKCMVRGVSELAFPEPEGGVITVEYPLALSPNTAPETPTLEPGLRLRSRLAYDAPVTRLEPGNDAWVDAVATSSSEVVTDTAGAKRDASELRQLVRGYLARGQLDAAHLAATLAVEDARAEPGAFELLVEAAAATGDRPRLLAAAAARVEREPENPDAQESAARAFEWAGEQQRACAHWRAAASLEYPSERARSAAASCTGAKAPESSANRSAALVARLECRGDCPSLLVIASDGRVFSEADSGELGVVRVPDIAYMSYRVLTVGTARGRVAITLDGETSHFVLDPSLPRTVAIVTR